MEFESPISRMAKLLEQRIDMEIASAINMDLTYIPGMTGTISKYGIDLAYGPDMTGYIPPSAIIHEFGLAGIEITDMQKESLANLEKVFIGIGDTLVDIISPSIIAMSYVFNTLKPTLIEMDKQDYIQKHKPWKKQRFYS